jgi:hypothetical protein
MLRSARVDRLKCSRAIRSSCIEDHAKSGRWHIASQALAHRAGVAGVAGTNTFASSAMAERTAG